MGTPQTPATVAQALRWAQAQHLDRLDAQLLVLHALGRGAQERAWLLAHDTDAFPEAAHATLQAAVLRRAAGEPLAYITGHKEFFGLDLQVDARVLVPRPDTETLVEWALELLSPAATPTHPARVVDLGTGSGAIALALKHTRPDLQVSAVDFSTDALAVAQANAQRLQLDVQFAQGSWLEAVPPDQRFDAIVSNPPYIASADHHLAALKHEPLQALASGADGLDDIRDIIRQARDHLSPGGWLLLEHGYDQAPAVRALLVAAGWHKVQSRRDLAGIERCSGGQWHGV
ncbi:peptide chain release factor N(5)-glutamine methyltransferase [Rhodoferax sp. AJA081-3]|uniref:peptide chain release factor N(5)-glutamine methyltransferase n=1 Tax=Rhodoferax sp. AJA081-3 TaxID=2752316 RepID=UPI001ADF296B|nr:peptide chain release factor N(5)-glutamine methyltransferase [Rhodoferax sp. AJA081-3]QTN27741.1 peptide chain release factor N(5)-glutamine methyltransferase [Rhodoferax sp. AJA081-3]